MTTPHLEIDLSRQQLQLLNGAGATLMICAVLVVTAGSLNAQQADSWIGKRVFTQYGTVLKVGNAVVDDEGRTTSLTITGKDRSVSRVYRVERVNGEWLWLKDETTGIAGWVQARQVIPYEQAIDHYTNLIRSNPQASTYNDRGNIWREKGEYDIILVGGGYFARDPSESRIFKTGTDSARLMGYSNPELDRLLSLGESSADPQTRAPTYHRAAEILNDELPWIVIAHEDTVWGVSRDLNGYQAAAANTRATMGLQDWSWKA